MATVAQTQLRSLDYYETKEGRQLCFNSTLRSARALPLGEIVEIIWSPCHPEAVERNAPAGADAYRMIGGPRRRLGQVETALIQYYTKE